MIINHNIAALNTLNRLNAASNAQSKSMEKLSSGLRINRAGDDAAGLAISEKMRAQIRGLDQASRNAQDSISLIQTAEGALNETHSILQRMRELAVQASNDTNTDEDRQEIQKEISQLNQEIDRIGNTTEFNTKKLLNGSIGTKADITSNSGDLNAISVSGTVALDGQYQLTITGGVKADYRLGNGATKADGTTAVTLDLTNDLGTLFGAGVFNGDESLSITQNGKTINVALNSTDKVGDVINRINAAAKDANMSFAASWDSTNKEISLASTEGGTAYSLTVVANNLGVNSTLGTVQTHGKTATDYSVAITNTATTLTDTVTLTSDKGEINSTATGLTGLTVDIKSTGSGASTINIQSGKLSTHIGANEGQTMDIQINDMRASKLGIGAVDENGNQSQFASLADIDVTTSDKAEDAITTINKAIEQVSAERSKLGAYQNRLEHTINNLATSSENLTASESRIRDVDMAKEMMEQTKSSILAQAAQAMLAQANQQPQGVLQLLR
ncbi:flagellin [Bacillus smithii]|uniref:flagellin N-terminal helical domain-containing protein n=1 Tax=Bacillus smithii TaxID=1479 RepID=UPI0022E77086|nr:flagellin [Bacillus smithii]